MMWDVLLGGLRMDGPKMPVLGVAGTAAIDVLALVCPTGVGAVGRELPHAPSMTSRGTAI